MSVAARTAERVEAPPAALARAGTRVLPLLAALVAASFLLRLVLGWLRATPTFFADEYIYAELGRSLAESGRPLIRGVSASFPALLQPLLTAPAWLVEDVETSFRIVQTLGRARHVAGGDPGLPPRAQARPRQGSLVRGGRARVGRPRLRLRLVGARRALRLPARARRRRRRNGRPRVPEPPAPARLSRPCRPGHLRTRPVRGAAGLLPRGRNCHGPPRAQNQIRAARAVARPRRPRAARARLRRGRPGPDPRLLRGDPRPRGRLA